MAATTTEAPVKILNLSDEITVRARNVLYFKEAIRSVLRELMKEVSKNQAETVRLWSDVRREADKQGIGIAPDEAFSFDFISEKFLIIKQQKADGG